MGIIDRMDERLRMETRNEEESLEVLHRFVKVEGLKIPEEYINVIKEGSDMEISVDDEMYIRIWGAEGCVEMNEAYNIQAELPNSLAIGDDEGGSAIIYMKGKKGKGFNSKRNPNPSSPSNSSKFFLPLISCGFHLM